MQPCSDCGRHHAAKAGACPFCTGQAPRQPRAALTGAALAGAALLGAACVAAQPQGVVYGPPPITPRPTASPTPAPKLAPASPAADLGPVEAIEAPEASPQASE